MARIGAKSLPGIIDTVKTCIVSHFVPGRRLLFLLSLLAALCVCIPACKKDGLLDADKNIQLRPRLSDYGIYQGMLADLKPAPGYLPYELSSVLFTDYAEKQRLIKVPAGSRATLNGDGLLSLPDGTILVKTFYYHHDKRDTAKGKKIIETRLLIRSGNNWNAGTYLWNDDQTDAWLLASGFTPVVNWIDASGKPRVVAYHVPGERECVTCHSSGDKALPIGLQARNLNRTVMRDGQLQNQLSYFHTEGIMEAVDPQQIGTMPDYADASQGLEQRARAYFDVNCAHCHSDNGYADGKTELRFGYGLSYSETHISGNKSQIIDKMKAGNMPKLGTTIVHEEGLDLIRQYINSL